MSHGDTRAANWRSAGGRLSRRRFLTTSSGAAAMAALASVLPAPPARADRANLKVGISVDPLTPGDPRQTMGGLVGLSQAQSHIFDTLIIRDWKMQLAPGLAERWEVVNPTTVRLYLRKGVKFHNGEPFDGQAVKYTFESIVAPESKSHRKSQIQAIKEVLVDSHTVDVRTSAPYRPIIRMIANIPIMAPRASQSMHEKIAVTPIGTGPFKSAEYVTGDRWVQQVNPDYWGPKPRIQQITWKYVKDDGARVAALLAGDVDVINNIPADQIGRVNAQARLTTQSVISTFLIYVGLRCDRPPFNDRRVRQAVNYAVNKKAIVDKLMGGLGEVADNALAPSLPYRQSFGTWPYDPDKAKALLKEAGYDPKTAPTAVFGSAVGRYMSDRAVGQAVSGYLDAIGFKHQFETPEWATFFGTVRRAGASRYDMFLVGYGPQSLEPDQLLSFTFQSTPTPNMQVYKNEQVDRLMQQGRETFDEAKLKAIYGELTKIVWEDAPVIWLHYQPEVTAYAKSLKGYAPRADSMMVVADAGW